MYISVCVAQNIGVSVDLGNQHCHHVNEKKKTEYG